MNTKKFYINGKWVDPVAPESLNIINPASEESIAEISVGTPDDIDIAVNATRKAFPSYSNTSVKERSEMLVLFREIFKKRFNDIADAISSEMGAPVKLARTAQTSVGLGHLKTAINVLENYEFEYKKNGFLIRHEPIGVCGLITPWNWPINQVMAKLAPCLAAGCTAVLKPSEIAPLSAMIVAEIIHEAGLPAGVFNLVNGFGPTVGEAMSSHPDIDMMSFTGSTRGGVAVAKASAATVKRVSQELGGKSANIVIDDSAFSASVENGVKLCMNNTGQSCNAPSRMLVPAHRHEEALTIAKATAESLVTGDPKSEGTDIGPLVSDVQFNKVQDLIGKGIEEGASLVTGGQNRPEGLKRGYFVRPTIFGHVSNSMTIAREEIFGPVLPIISYKDNDDAIGIANDTEYGLAAYVSGDASNKESLLGLARHLRAGQVHINYQGGGTEAPFGGYKQSGNGREKAEWGLHDFLEVKAVIGI